MAIDPQPQVAGEDEEGIPLPIAVGIPLALLLLAALITLCVCLALRRRKKVPDTTPIGGTQAFANNLYDLTPGQAAGVQSVIMKRGPLPEKPGIVNVLYKPDNEMEAAGREPEYEMLPEKKDPVPSDSRITNHYTTLPEKKGPLLGSMVETDLGTSTHKNKAEEAAYSSQYADVTPANQQYANIAQTQPSITPDSGHIITPDSGHIITPAAAVRDSDWTIDMENLNNILSEGRVYEEVSPLTDNYAVEPQS